MAILLVLVYHAGALGWRLAPYGKGGWIVLPHLGAAWLLVPPLHFGFVGVQCFFVLSGFCIHLRAARLLAAGDPALPSVRDFFARRFWRIVPPYWIALGIFGVLAPLVARALHLHLDAPPPSLRYQTIDLAAHALLLHTLSARTIFSIDPAFWSLATEAQFYLVYPLLLPWLRRLGMRRVLELALMLSLAWRVAMLAALPPTVENFMTYRVLLHALFLPRWFEWLLGCALAEAWADRSSPLDGRARSLALAGGALLLLGMGVRMHVALDKLLSDVLFASAFTAIAGAALVSPPLSGRVAAWVGHALEALGKHAYGLYLVHQPIYDWQAIPRLARIVLGTACGWLFSSLVERPFERRAQRVGRTNEGATAQAALGEGR